VSEATYPVTTIAKLLILTERQVQSLAKQGVLPKTERARYELVPVVQAYIRYLRERAMGGAVGGTEDDRGRLTRAKADIAEMEAERLREILIPEDQIRPVVTAFVARFKQKTLAVAPKAAPMVAVETEPDACHDIIETFLLEALAELAGMDVEIGSAPGLDNDPESGDAGDDPAAQADRERVGRSQPQAQPRGQRRARSVADREG
jgi:hypothetical protein